jgi:ATP synthase H subunit
MESLKKIRLVEQKVENRISKSLSKKETALRNAEVEAEKIISDSRKSAEKHIEKLIDSEKTKAEKEAKKILDETDNELNALNSRAKKRINPVSSDVLKALLNV